MANNNMNGRASVALNGINKAYPEYAASNNASADSALTFLKKVAVLLGKEVKTQSPLMEVEGNTVYMGASSWTVNDRMVVDGNDHPFRGLILLQYVKEKQEEKLLPGETKVLHPVQAFIFCFAGAVANVLDSYIKNSKLTTAIQPPDNIGALVQAELDGMEWSSSTSDQYSFIDGGSELVLASSYVPISKNVSKSELGTCSPKLCASAIPHIFEEFGLVHVFHKGIFLIKDLICSDAGESVQAYSSKAAKGPKRVLLPMARSARVMNARSAGWMLPRQLEPIMGHVANAGFFPTLALPPGHSLWVSGKSNLPEAVVPHTFKGFEVEAKEIGNEITSLVGDGYEDTNGRWTVLDFTGLDVCIEKGATIAVVNGAEVEHTGCASVLQWMRWTIITGASGTRRVKFEYRTVTIERTFKSRSIAKAQPILSNASVIYNSMNENLPAGLDIVHGMDSIKCDVTYSWLLVASTTALHNNDEELLGHIKAINKVTTGVAHADYLYINPELTFSGYGGQTNHIGVYQPLLNAFIKKYGRSCWFQFRDSGDFSRIMHELYVTNTPGGWEEIEVPNEMGVKLLPGYSFKAYKEAGADVQDEKTNILIFAYQGETVIAHWQRCFGYVGVKNLEGFETSTVQQSVGSSQQLASYGRSLTRLHGMSMEELQAMMSEGKEGRIRTKVLHVMNAGNRVGCPVEDETFLIDPTTEEGMAVIRSEVAKYELDLGLAGRKDLFKNLTSIFKNHWFFLPVGDYGLNIWLPALLSLNAVKSASESGTSMSSIMREYILRILTNDETLTEDQHNLYCRRMRGMLNALLSNKNAWKLQGGRISTVAKRITLPNIPCGEVWILQSEDPNSLHAQARANGLKDGDTVGDNRAPMADGSVSKLRFISEEENESNLWQMSAYQLGVNCMSVYIDGGDFDGDGQYTTKVNESLATSTFESVREVRSAMLGVDMFHPLCEGYARDHYGIKRFAKVQHGVIGKNVMTREQFIYNLVGACVVQQQMVGFAYTLANLTEINQELLSSLAGAGVELPKRLQWVLRGGDITVAKGYEAEEVPLGGYSPDIYKLWQNHTSKLLNQREDIYQVTTKDFASFAESMVAIGADKRDDAVQQGDVSLKNLAAAFNTAAITEFVCKQKVNKGQNISGAVDTLISQYCDEPDMALMIIMSLALSTPDVVGAYKFNTYIINQHRAKLGRLLYAFCVSFAVLETARGKDSGIQFIDGTMAPGTDGADVIQYITSYHTSHKAEDWYKAWMANSSCLQLMIQHIVRNTYTATTLVAEAHLTTTDIEVMTRKVKAKLVASEPKVEVAEVSEVAKVPASTSVDYEVFEYAEVVLDESDIIYEEDICEEVASDELLEVVASVSTGKSKGKGYAVMAFSAMTDSKGHMIACNSNLPVGFFGDFNADIRTASDKNYAAFGFCQSGGNMNGYSVSPIGFTAAKARVRKQGMLQMGYTNSAFISTDDVLQESGVTMVLGSRTQGALDCKLNKTSPQKGEAELNLDVIRESILNGESIEHEGTSVVSHLGVKDVLKDGTRKWFIAIGEVEDVHQLVNGSGRQSQIICSSITVAQVTDPAAAFLAEGELHDSLKLDALVERFYSKEVAA